MKPTVSGVNKNPSGSHKDRASKRISWGDCGTVRPPTEEYVENLNRIFGEKEKKEKILSPEEKERQKRNAAIRARYPY